jgi:hypothetical protein
VPRQVAQLVTRLVTLLVVDYSTSRRLVVDYFASTARLGASARRAARHAARRVAPRRLLCIAQARRRLLCLRRASGYLGTSRGSSRRSSSTTPPRVGSSSTTSPLPRVRVPQHVTRLVTRLVGPLVVDYSASCRLVIDYSPSRRLVVDNSASRRLVIDYFASAARPAASARHAARHAARRAARRRLLCLTQARRRPLRLHRASGCFGTSRGSSCGSSHRLAVDYSASRRLVVDYSASRRLVVDYFASAARSGASARHAARHAALLTDKRRIPLRSASVRTPHLFHHGIPKVLVNPRSKGLQAFNLLLRTSY